MILNELFWGVRVWIWLYLLLSILGFIIVMILIFRKAIVRQYYKIRHPEKIIKIIIHYPNSMFKTFFRLIPDVDHFTIENIKYRYDDKKIIKENDFYSKVSKSGKLYVNIEGNRYDLNKKLSIKNRWSKYTELHYFYNCVSPIEFKISAKNKSLIDVTGRELDLMKKNDLFTKLLTLDGEKSLMMFVLILGFANAILSFAILGKLLEWF